MQLVCDDINNENVWSDNTAYSFVDGAICHIDRSHVYSYTFYV